MKGKRKRKLDAGFPPPLPTFDTLTVCFTDRTITFRGKTFTSEANCVSMPILSDQLVYLSPSLARSGHVPSDYS